jgi:hypothetical protein
LDRKSTSISRHESHRQGRLYSTEGRRSGSAVLALRAVPSGTVFLTMSGLAHTEIVWLVGLLKKRLSGGQAARNMKLPRMVKPRSAAQIFWRRENPF